MEGFTSWDVVKAHLLEALKKAPKVIMWTLGISVVVTIVYYVVMTLLTVQHMM